MLTHRRLATLRVIFAVLVFALTSPPGALAAFNIYYMLPGDFHVTFNTHRIAFNTLPDGQPSIPGTLITPTFNWTAQGAEFAPGAGTLLIANGPPPTNFSLQATDFGLPNPNQHN